MIARQLDARASRKRSQFSIRANALRATVIFWIAPDPEEITGASPAGHITFANRVSKWVPGSCLLWNSGRERHGRIQYAQQEQTLVILLQTIFSHFAHDQIPNLRQGPGSVLRQLRSFFFIGTSSGVLDRRETER
jgi:hypothetical protein